jgi:hypothetical protein
MGSRRTDGRKRPSIEAVDADGRDPGCAGAFEIADQYVELELAGQDAVTRFPGFAIHLRSCPACRVDYQGLLAAARARLNAEST